MIYYKSGYTRGGPNDQATNSHSGADRIHYSRIYVDPAIIGIWADATTRRQHHCVDAHRGSVSKAGWHGLDSWRWTCCASDRLQQDNWEKFYSGSSRNVSPRSERKSE